MLDQIGHLARHHGDDAEEQGDDEDQEGDVDHQHRDQARPAITLKIGDQALQEVGNDDTRQGRGQHVAHGEDHGKAHQEGSGQKDYLGIGKITPEPVGDDLHGRKASLYGADQRMKRSR